MWPSTDSLTAVISPGGFVVRFMKLNHVKYHVKGHVKCQPQSHVVKVVQYSGYMNRTVVQYMSAYIYNAVQQKMQWGSTHSEQYQSSDLFSILLVRYNLGSQYFKATVNCDDNVDWEC